MAYAHALNIIRPTSRSITITSIFLTKPGCLLVQHKNSSIFLNRSKFLKCNKDAIDLAVHFGCYQYRFIFDSIREGTGIRSLHLHNYRMVSYLYRWSSAFSVVGGLLADLASIIVRKLAWPSFRCAGEYCLRYFSFTVSN